MRDSGSAPVFFTPEELCDRWRINRETLDKFELPWFRPTPRVRRIAVAFVLQYEQQQRLGDWSTQ